MTDNTTTQMVPVSAGTTVITEDVYNTLNKMLGSNDEGDHKMAQLILNQVDVEKSIYWIWKLSRWYSNRMVNLRTKASRKFRDESRLFHICNKGGSSFATFLANYGWITPEIFSFLKEDIIKDVRNKSSNAFYKVSIILKDDLKHLDPEDKLITITPGSI